MNRAFGEATGLFRERAGLYILIALVFALPGEIAEFLAGGGDGGNGGAAATFVPLMFTVLFGAVAEAAITLGALGQVRGAAPGGNLVQAGLGHYGAILLAYLIVMVGFTLGLFFLIVPGVIFMSLVFFAIPPILEENVGGLAGIERSIALGQGNRLEIFFLTVLYMLILLGGGWMLEAMLPGVAGTLGTWLFEGAAGAYGIVLAVAGYAQLRQLEGNPIGRGIDPG